MDAIARMPGNAGENSDAVGAYTSRIKRHGFAGRLLGAHRNMDIAPEAQTTGVLENSQEPSLYLVSQSVQT